MGVPYGVQYTHAIQDIDEGRLPEWAGKPAPEIAINYWRLPKDATMRDLLLVVRADEVGRWRCFSRHFTAFKMHADSCMWFATTRKAPALPRHKPSRKRSSRGRGQRLRLHFLTPPLSPVQACHSHVNAVFAELGADAPNPFSTGSHEVA